MRSRDWCRGRGADIRVLSGPCRSVGNVNDEHPICERCGDPIDSADDTGMMARQVEATAMNPAGQRSYTDGLTIEYAMASR